MEDLEQQEELLRIALEEEARMSQTNITPNNNLTTDRFEVSGPGILAQMGSANTVVYDSIDWSGMDIQGIMERIDALSDPDVSSTNEKDLEFVKMDDPFNGGKTFKQREKDIREVAEEIFPGKWDLSPVYVTGELAEYRPNDRSRFKLTIHFPKFEITNGRNSREITDLYVIMYFDKYLKHSSGWFGYRGSVAYEEMTRGYKHSHLHTDRQFGVGSFCLGSGPVPNLVNGLIADGFCKADLRRALIMMISYVPWESIDGVPYIRMNTLGNNTSRLPNVTYNQIANALNTYLNETKELPIEVVDNGTYCTYKIRKTDRKFLRTLTSYDINNVIRGENGEVYARDSNLHNLNGNITEFNNRMNTKSKSLSIIYKGKRILTKCLNLDEGDTNKEPEFVAHPKLVDEVAYSIEKQLNTYYIKKLYHELKQSH